MHRTSLPVPRGYRLALFVSAILLAPLATAAPLIHQRAVVRYQNVVAGIYFFGAENVALRDADQVHEWLGKIQERRG